MLAPGLFYPSVQLEYVTLVLSIFGTSSVLTSNVCNVELEEVPIFLDFPKMLHMGTIFNLSTFIVPMNPVISDIVPYILIKRREQKK